MKRGLALVLLLSALSVMLKLAARPASAPRGGAGASHLAAEPAAPDPAAELAARYESAPASVRELVDRVGKRFGRRALEIDRSDGQQGLELLDRLDLEAVFLQEKRPVEFRRLRAIVGDESAADLLGHWREYFGLKRADQVDRAILIDEIAALSPGPRRLAARYPSALPLILAEPQGVCALVEQAQSRGIAAADQADMLAVLSFVSLDRGPGDLRRALRILARHGRLALQAFRLQGPLGFGLVARYADVFAALEGSLPLDQALILARVNSAYLDEFLRTHRPETAATHLRRVAEAGLIAEAGGCPGALRLVVELGALGERALRVAGADAANVLDGAYREPVLERQAVRALGEHGPMALYILDKYADDPGFRAILRGWGPAVVPPIARADVMPEAVARMAAKPDRGLAETVALATLFAAGESGQGVIRTIERDGLDRALGLADPALSFAQFLPLYDVVHLGKVVGRGYAPTNGEALWGLIDGCFVIADVLALAAGPEGALAGAGLEREAKAAVRSAVREAAETAAGRTAAAGTSQRIFRFWSVRKAGGVFRVLSRSSEALERLDLAALSAAGNEVCSQAGLRLGTWKPISLVRDGVRVIVAIPPGRGLKYVSLQIASAGVGVVGFHKMEEHLAARRTGRGSE